MRPAGLSASLLLAAGCFLATLCSGFAALCAPRPLAGPIPANFVAVGQTSHGSIILRGGENPPTGASMLWSGSAQPPGLRLTVIETAPAENRQTIMVETTSGSLVTSVYRATADGYTPLAYSNPDPKSVQAVWLTSLGNALAAGLAAALLSLLIGYQITPG